MSQEDKDPSKVLEYGKSTKISLWKFWAVGPLLAILGFLLLLIGFASAGKELLSCVTATVGFIGFVLWTWRTRPKRLPDAEEEQLEEEWEQRKVEMAAAAARVYERFPLGVWVATSTTPGLSRLSPTVHEDRLLQLHKDGSGSFKFYQLNPPVDLQTTFQYRAGESEGTFLVQLASPSVPVWHAVKFEFEVIGGSAIRKDESELELVIIFEGENPLNGDLSNFWPFTGRYFRFVE